MYVISAGLQKSGSAWFYQITDAMLAATGHTPARDLKVKYGLEALLRDYNCAVSRMEPQLLALLTKLGTREGCFVVKTHAPPTEALKIRMTTRGAPRATLIYRDPRDVAISALEHGQRLRLQGLGHLPFAQLRTVHEALITCRLWLREMYLPWSQLPGTFRVSYEALMEEPLAISRALAHYLELEISDAILQGILDNLEASTIQRESAQAKRLHLNSAEVYRYRSLMTLGEQRLALRILGPWLDLLGYDPTIRECPTAPGVQRMLNDREGPAQSAPAPLALSA